MKAGIDDICNILPLVWIFIELAQIRGQIKKLRHDVNSMGVRLTRDYDDDDDEFDEDPFVSPQGPINKRAKQLN